MGLLRTTRKIIYERDYVSFRYKRADQFFICVLPTADRADTVVRHVDPRQRHLPRSNRHAHGKHDD